MRLLWCSLAVMVLLSQYASSLSLSKAAEKKKMVCYYGSWAVYRPGNGKFDVENIDPFICTHVIYTFTGITTNGTMIPLDPYNDLYENWGKGAFLRFTGLKKKNPQLKTIIAVGGWNEGSEKYSQMAADPTKRSTFVNSVLNFLITYGFDGFDFDWEYPANRGGAVVDKINFIQVLRELKTAFTPYGFTLSAAVSSGKSTVDSGYDIPAMSSLLDHINLMAYDFHGAWDSYTGLNSPLYANPKYDFGEDLFLNVNWTINYWISKGASPSKLVLGMPLYGRGWILANSNQNGFYANAYQPISAGPYTRESGSWGYNEICEKFSADPRWTIIRDPLYKAPYAYNGNQWLGYDDRESLRLKAQYALSMGLGGAMVWSIETDDFRGLCGEPFVLIKTINEVMNGPIVIEPTTVPSPTTTSSAVPITTRTTVPTVPTVPTVTTTPGVVTVTAATTICGSTTVVPSTQSSTQFTTVPPLVTSTGTPIPNTICKTEGLNPDPYDCQIFYTCINNGQGGWTVYTQKCASGTVFSAALQTCTYPNQVPGCENYPA